MRIKREAEESARARQEAAKREKESAKRALKRERKQLQTFGKQLNYFTSEEPELITRMTDLDRLCELLPVDEYVRQQQAKTTKYFSFPFLQTCEIE